MPYREIEEAEMAVGYFAVFCAGIVGAIGIICIVLVIVL